MTAAAPEKPDVQEMVLIHRVIRREAGLLPRLIRGVSDGDTARAAVLAEHTSFMFDGLQQHHSGEDTLLWPKLLDRAKPEADVVNRMQKQHDEIAAGVEKLRGQLSTWQASPTTAHGEELANSIDQLNGVLFEHLADEEKHILPLVSEYITVAEWNQVGEDTLAKTPRNRLLLQLGAILEDANADEEKTILSKVPAPARLLWRVIGRRQYRRYTTKIRSG
jgi:hemerythrin-like domain-containing protein